jgi:hypothetical protein
MILNIIAMQYFRTWWQHADSDASASFHDCHVHSTDSVEFNIGCPIVVC